VRSGNGLVTITFLTTATAPIVATPEFTG